MGCAQNALQSRSISQPNPRWWIASVIEDQGNTHGQMALRLSPLRRGGGSAKLRLASLDNLSFERRLRGHSHLRDCDFLFSLVAKIKHNRQHLVLRCGFQLRTVTVHAVARTTDLGAAHEFDPLALRLTAP